MLQGRRTHARAVILNRFSTTPPLNNSPLFQAPDIK